MDQLTGKFILYRIEGKKKQLPVLFQEETVWLTQLQIAHLFDTTKQNVSLHILSIFRGWESQANSLVRVFMTTAANGHQHAMRYYNLDVIEAIGERIRSRPGRHFLMWASRRLRKPEKRK